MTRSLCFAILLGLPAFVAARGVVRPPASPIDGARWMQGCWAGGTAPETVEEQWMAPRGGNMLGMSRTVRNGKLLDYELVLLREESSTLVYEVHPSGQPAASFPSTDVSDSSILFENTGHDFPQRIGYRRSGADSLIAWIEGTHNGASRRIEYPYRRVGCPAS